MKESMREAFLRSATAPLCSGDPGDPGSYHGGYFLAEVINGIVHCCGDNRCASGFHPTCDKVLSAAEIRRMGNRSGARWLECVPEVDEDGSPAFRILLAVGLGVGTGWLGARWAVTKSLPGWSGPGLGVLTALLVLWLIWPRRKGM